MRKIIELDFSQTLKSRIDQQSNLLQVVLGPRQVGKTTTILKLIKDYYPNNSLYVSADRIFNASAEWLLDIWLEAQQNEKILFIDEIQKIENWSETIKVLYDRSKAQEKNTPCVLLGSSSLEIQKGLTESLTGRFQLINTYHWNYVESQVAYDLNFKNYLKHGGYPGSYQFINTKEWFDYVQNSIVSTVIEKDILQFQTVKNPSLFKQAFELIMSYPAQEISYTKLLGQLQDKGNVELIKYYLKLYEGAFLVKVLEKFSQKAVKVKSSSPKILPMSPSLAYLAIRDEYTADEFGRIFEVIVGNQLVRTNEKLYYWREGKHEVDYVLQKGRALYAIEVKSGQKKKLKGLVKFKDKFPQGKLIVINLDNYFEFEKDPLAYIESNAR